MPVDFVNQAVVFFARKKTQQMEIKWNNVIYSDWIQGNEPISSYLAEHVKKIDHLWNRLFLINWPVSNGKKLIIYSKYYMLYKKLRISNMLLKSCVYKVP